QSNTPAGWAGVSGCVGRRAKVDLNSWSSSSSIVFSCGEAPSQARGVGGSAPMGDAQDAGLAPFGAVEIFLIIVVRGRDRRALRPDLLPEEGAEPLVILGADAPVNAAAGRGRDAEPAAS